MEGMEEIERQIEEREKEVEMEEGKKWNKTHIKNLLLPSGNHKQQKKTRKEKEQTFVSHAKKYVPAFRPVSVCTHIVCEKNYICM